MKCSADVMEAAYVSSDHRGLEKLWEWARKHSGTLAVGVLLVGALVIARPHGKTRVASDLDAGEAPLFI